MTVRKRGKGKSNKKGSGEKVSEGATSADFQKIDKLIDKTDEQLDELLHEKEEVVEEIHKLETEVEKIDDKIQDVAHTQKKYLTKKANNNTIGQHFWEKRRFVLVFGIIIGLFIAAYSHKEYISSDILSGFDEYLNLDSLNLDSLSLEGVDWKGYLPDGLLNTMEKRKTEAQQESGAFSVGLQLNKEGTKAKHNVVMVPGVVSTGLESWGLEGSSEDCPSKNYFRKRLWGSFFMLRTMFLEKLCWIQHLELDPETGLDPPGVKLRAAQGFEAADFFVTGYWIWNKVLQNLAAIGYGPDNMFSAAYDWRLAYYDLERRDGYFSKLKAQIETTNKLQNERTVLMGHSMGAQIAFYFLQWVEAPIENGGGGGGSTWVNDHIAALVDISGSTLGTPKAVTALLSGEMRDTVQLNAMAVYGLEKFFSKRERAHLLQTFGGIPGMLPKGGEKLWGSANNGAPDDKIVGKGEKSVIEGDDTFANFIRLIGESGDKNLSITDSIELLLDEGPEWFKRRINEQYSFGYAKSAKELEKNKLDKSKWSNPLEVALPNAPDMKIFCFYGVGKPTERAYFYKEDESGPLGVSIANENPQGGESVLLGEGDGTVSILTHSMCHKWAEENSYYNPGNSEVITVELPHMPDVFDLRGGADTAEHVDILGSARLNELLLRVASGEKVEERLVTRLREIVSEIDFFE